MRAVRKELAARLRNRDVNGAAPDGESENENSSDKQEGGDYHNTPSRLVTALELELDDDVDGLTPEFCAAAAAAQRALARAVSAELEDQLTDVLICLGQETTKVEVLTYALNSFGVEVPRLLTEAGYSETNHDSSVDYSAVDSNAPSPLPHHPPNPPNPTLPKSSPSRSAAEASETGTTKTVATETAADILKTPGGGSSRQEAGGTSKTTPRWGCTS